ncbi:ethanolamine ammonia-lyase subunit EutC [Rhodovarius crocodyli]|uniref:Ethanolamine ammonia-lyase small subunit n=1 Tax=Rhodovarius crocodyli TaxID=1979269 RepID=A0A437MMN5_9PROT|nr:ethanolamine ammonia-lyase subunit EutC [Rhodovarius crocodyli]RVT98901.1 ethanolamine ammonia-lyase subunit EutC [Rhodovarius crocodyli]
MLPSSLRRFTSARVGLGRVGTAQPSGAQLAFNAAHAAARDAVWSLLDTQALVAALPGPVLRVRSQARDRREYLLRPDLGRKLHPEDAAMLAGHAAPGSLVFLVADGLCATGVQAHAPALIRAVAPLLGLPLGPVVVAEQARVALGDAVGEALGAAAVAVLIGERPGLSATDSLGCYLTWAPRIGRTDAERNCISNIRPEGMPPAEAAPKLAWLVRAAMELGETGVALKDESPNVPLIAP